MFSKKKRIHIDDKEAITLLHNIIYNKILNLNYQSNMNLIVLCIGTDRSTGDSLGPLIGTMLKEGDTLSANVIGNIDQPVHASNLDHIIKYINENFTHPFVIAIDAGLGKQSSVGYIDVKNGPLKPGTGVNKELTQIGDMHITGLVNVGGYMEYLVLQSTRLSLVIKMAKTISDAIQLSIDLLQEEKSAID